VVSPFSVLSLALSPFAVTPQSIADHGREGKGRLFHESNTHTAGGEKEERKRGGRTCGCVESLC
jgi:hypothetical protein